MISSSELNLLLRAMSLSSIEVSPNSFSMIAIFFPCVAPGGGPGQGLG
jgi:hypothetical protein|tara:strand:- start:157 stop:300 length:144 start_codon:yes stop_codon:yes gene_type:complete